MKSKKKQICRTSSWLLSSHYPAHLPSQQNVEVISELLRGLHGPSPCGPTVCPDASLTVPPQHFMVQRLPGPWTGHSFPCPPVCSYSRSAGLFESKLLATFPAPARALPPLWRPPWLLWADGFFLCSQYTWYLPPTLSNFQWFVCWCFWGCGSCLRCFVSSIWDCACTLLCIWGCQVNTPSCSFLYGSCSCTHSYHSPEPRMQQSARQSSRGAYILIFINMSF